MVLRSFLNGVAFFIRSVNVAVQAVVFDPKVFGWYVDVKLHVFACNVLFVGEYISGIYTLNPVNNRLLLSRNLCKLSFVIVWFSGLDSVFGEKEGNRCFTATNNLDNLLHCFVLSIDSF